MSTVIEQRVITESSIPLSERSPLYASTKPLLAGYASGCALVLAGHPIDTIKVRLQTTQQSVSIIQCISDTVRNEGILAVYKGMLTPLMLTGIVNSVMFGLLHAADKHIVTPIRGQHTTGSTYNMSIAGIVSGIGIATIVTPMELIKSRLQVNRATNNPMTPLQCAKQLYNTNGITGLYRGFTSVILTRGSNYSYFGSYTYIKQRILSTHQSDNNKLSMTESIFCGASAGVIYWLSCYQYDTIKARIMTQPLNMPASICNTAKQIYAEGGIKAFYRGFLPCVVRAIPANAAAFTAYEIAMSVLPP